MIRSWRDNEIRLFGAICEWDLSGTGTLRSQNVLYVVWGDSGRNLGVERFFKIVFW